MWLRLQGVYLAYTKPWLQSPTPHKSDVDVVEQPCDPSTRWKGEDQKSKVILRYIVDLRPTWETGGQNSWVGTGDI